MKIQRITISLILVLVIISNPASANFSENSRQGSPAISADSRPAPTLGNAEHHQGLTRVLLELLSDSLFLTKDPISFGGGRNLWNYVGNNPVRYVDRNGTYLEFPESWDNMRIWSPHVTYNTLRGPLGPELNDGRGRLLYWRIQWGLDSPTNGGLIVQYTRIFDLDIKDCLGYPRTDLMDAFRAKYPFWEPWEVTSNNIGTLKDTWFFPDFADTKGSFGTEGYAKYYELMAIPNDWQPTGQSPTWRKRVARSDPHLRGLEAAGPLDSDVHRSIRVTWDSSDPQQNTIEVLY